MPHNININIFLHYTGMYLCTMYLLFYVEVEVEGRSRSIKIWSYEVKVKDKRILRVTDPADNIQYFQVRVRVSSSSSSSSRIRSTYIGPSR